MAIGLCKVLPGPFLALRPEIGQPRRETQPLRRADRIQELLSKVVDGASGGDLILPDSVDEFHIFNDLSQAAVAW